MTKHEYYMNKLAEECGELVQITIKTKIFGIDNVNPKTNESNRDQLKNEMCDVLTSIKIISEAYGIEITDEDMVARKEKMDHYYLVSQVK